MILNTGFLGWMCTIYLQILRNTYILVRSSGRIGSGSRWCSTSRSKSVRFVLKKKRFFFFKRHRFQGRGAEFDTLAAAVENAGAAFVSDVVPGLSAALDILQVTQMKVELRITHTYIYIHAILSSIVVWLWGCSGKLVYLSIVCTGCRHRER